MRKRFKKAAFAAIAHSRLWHEPAHNRRAEHVRSAQVHLALTHVERGDPRDRDGALVTRSEPCVCRRTCGSLGFIVVLLLMIIRSHLGTAHQCSRPLSEIGTKLPIQNVRSPVANGGKADNICSLRDLPVLTHIGHFALLSFCVAIEI